MRKQYQKKNVRAAEKNYDCSCVSQNSNNSNMMKTLDEIIISPLAKQHSVANVPKCFSQLFSRFHLIFGMEKS